MGLCKHNPLQIWLDQSAVFSNNHIQVGHRGRVERPSVRVLIPSLPNIRPSLRLPVPLAQVLRSHRVPGLVARVVCKCIKRLNALPTHTSLHLRLPPMYSRLEHPYRKTSYTPFKPAPHRIESLRKEMGSNHNPGHPRAQPNTLTQGGVSNPTPSNTTSQGARVSIVANPCRVCIKAGLDGNHDWKTCVRREGQGKGILKA